jgi:hypothetical protein
VSSASCSKEQIEKWTSLLVKVVQGKEEERQRLENRVKALIVAPSDEELDKRITAETTAVAALEERMNEIKALEKEAEKQGKNMAVVNAESEADARLRLEFFLRQVRDRKRTVMEFVDTVCDAKGLRGAARRDFIDTIGLEME